MSSTSHSHRRPRRLLAAICAAALLAGAAACGTSAQAGDDATMRVAYLSTANYLTTVRDEPFLDETMGSTNVDFTGPYNPTDAYAAVLSGNADATSTGTGSFIKFLAQGQPWTAFAIEYYNGDSQGIVAAPGSGVESLDDLAGKKVAIIKRGGTGSSHSLSGQNLDSDRSHFRAVIAVAHIFVLSGQGRRTRGECHALGMATFVVRLGKSGQIHAAGRCPGYG